MYVRVYVQDAAFNVTHFELAILLAWIVGGVADNGGWVPCGLGFNEQWNVDPCSSAYFVWNSSCQASRSYPCSESFVGNLVMIGNVGLQLQEK
jgi:hypothetical protein